MLSGMAGFVLKGITWWLLLTIVIYMMKVTGVFFIAAGKSGLKSCV